jgi:hypothetical protein
MVHNEHRDLGEQAEEVVDLTPTMPSDPLHILRELLSRGFCDSNLKQLYPPDPIILQPYQNLKKALQQGFCDPSGLLRPNDEDKECASIVTLSVDSDDGTKNVMQQEEEDRERNYIVVTHPEGCRLERIARALETVLFAFLFLYWTLSILSSMNVGFGMEFRPKQESGRPFFHIG